MNKEVDSKKIIEQAFKGQDPFIIQEIARETSISFLGSTNVDLYITVNKMYIEKRVRSNLSVIEKAIKDVSGKTIRDIYINQAKEEMSIKELKQKDDIKQISIEDFKRERTAEISGENDIVKESTFKYDASILNKKIIVIEMHNKKINRQYKTEFNKTLLTNTFNVFKRRSLIKKIKHLLDIGYEPANNDTTEVLDFLKINKK